MQTLENKAALITGANRGIGKVTVEAFLAAGAAKVYAGARSLATLDPLVDAHPGRVVPLRIDLTEPDSIQAAAEAAADLQILVNNAGLLELASPLADRAVEALNREMAVNVHGLLYMAQAFAPVLEANGGGVFVQINSIASMKNFVDLATYSASKAASYSITQGLRELLAKQGTRVLSVHPGPIATDMAESAGLAAMAEPASLVPEAILAALETDEFHVFPDTMARQVGAAYRDFARDIVEADLMEA